MKRIIAFLLMLYIFLIPLPTPGATKSYNIIDFKKLSIDEGKKCTLVLPAKYKNVKWSSNDKEVVTVNKSGSLIAVNGGDATVTAKSGKKTFKCYVTVNEDYTEWVRYTTDDLGNLIENIIDGNVVKIGGEYYCSPEYFETFPQITEEYEEDVSSDNESNHHILTPDAEFVTGDRVKTEEEIAKENELRKELEALEHER